MLALTNWGIIYNAATANAAYISKDHVKRLNLRFQLHNYTRFSPCSREGDIASTVFLTHVRNQDLTVGQGKLLRSSTSYWFVSSQTCCFECSLKSLSPYSCWHRLLQTHFELFDYHVIRAVINTVWYKSTSEMTTIMYIYHWLLHILKCASLSRVPDFI